MMPIQVISKPDAHQERIVINDFNAPTRKCATKLIPKEMITAVIRDRTAAVSAGFPLRDFIVPLVGRVRIGD